MKRAISRLFSVRPFPPLLPEESPLEHTRVHSFLHFTHSTYGCCARRCTQHWEATTMETKCKPGHFLPWLKSLTGILFIWEEKDFIPCPAIQGSPSSGTPQIPSPVPTTPSLQAPNTLDSLTIHMSGRNLP